MEQQVNVWIHDAWWVLSHAVFLVAFGLGCLAPLVGLAWLIAVANGEIDAKPWQRKLAATVLVLLLWGGFTAIYHYFGHEVR